MIFDNLISFCLLICILFSQFQNFNCKSIRAIKSIQNTNIANKSKKIISVSDARTSESLKIQDIDIVNKSISENVAANKSMKIISGTDAELGEFPSIVSLQKYGGHFCGGTLYTNYIVITAAHCVVDITEEMIESSGIFILSGDILLSNSGTPTRSTRNIIRVVKHPQYDYEKTGFLNDIAIIELREPFEISKNLRPIDITSGNSPQTGDICKIAGWGTVASSKNEEENEIFRSDRLQKAEIEILSNDVCKEKYEEEYFIPQMLCAGGEGKDACQGDSGGPLICDGILYGVISSGSGCGDDNNPGVYTNIASYRDWLDSAIGVTNLIGLMRNKSKASDIQYKFINKIFPFVFIIINYYI